MGSCIWGEKDRNRKEVVMPVEKKLWEISELLDFPFFFLTRVLL